MPKFIGQEIPGSSPLPHDNATEASTGLVRLTYAQARLLPPEDVRVSLDTTDKGSRGRYAKRWYRWFASPMAIRRCCRRTAAMVRKTVNSDTPA